jgi:demethylmenaquinone methyltransferase / 2-methoxy-6-polyprenyl-1,4-benzoquinol methylase
MTDFQMPPIDKKAQFVQENFNIIANKYDLFNDLNTFFMHRFWKNNLAKRISNHFNGKRIQCMDLCCGTGDISVRLSELQIAEKVYAVDFSENMLNIAKTRLSNKSNSSTLQGDATNLSNFKDNSLDAITIGFGLRNVDKLEKTLLEVHRILKPGGIFLNLEVGKVTIPIIKFFADFYFFKIVPILGYIIWGGKNKMFDYLPVSSLHYPDQESLKEKLIAAGFINVTYTNYVFGNVALHISYK